jgi:hypothetical protein
MILTTGFNMPHKTSEKPAQLYETWVVFSHQRTLSFLTICQKKKNPISNRKQSHDD